MLAARLAEMRKKRCLSQAALAALINMSQQAVGAWETGVSSPSPQQIHDICCALNVSSDYLLELTDEAKPLPSAHKEDALVHPVELKTIPEGMRADILALIRSEIDKLDKG